LLVAIRFVLDRVIDLTAANSVQALGITIAELAAGNWRDEQQAGHESLAQAIGHAAYAERAAGLLVPSAQVHGGVNIVCFPERLRKGTVMQIEGEEELIKLCRQ
jgi:RES domain-containing protein